MQRSRSSSIPDAVPRLLTPIPTTQHPRQPSPHPLPHYTASYTEPPQDQHLSPLSTESPSEESKDSDHIILNPNLPPPPQSSRPQPPLPFPIMAHPGNDITKLQSMVKGITFEGKLNENVDNFLRQFNKAADRWGASQEDKAMALWSTCLKGDAQAWFQSLPPDVMDDFNLLSMELREHFGLHPIQCEEAFMNCKQRIGESTVHFWRRAETLRQQLNLPALDTAQQIQWIWIRLHPQLLIGRKPADFPNITALLEHCKWQELTPILQSPAFQSVPVYQVYAHQYHGHLNTQPSRDSREYQDAINRAYGEGKESESRRNPTPQDSEGDLLHQIQQLMRRNGPKSGDNYGQGGGQGQGNGGGNAGGRPTSRRWCDNCRMDSHYTNQCNTFWCDYCQVTNHSTRDRKSVV